MDRTDAAEMLTTAEVAESFRVNPSTVLRWANEGKLPVTKLGPKTFRFRRSDVEALIGGHSTKAAS